MKAERRGPLQIIHEDADLIVVNKPAGWLSVPLERNPAVPSVYDLIVDRYRSHGKRRPLVVHRIDQDTSGVVIFARNTDAQQKLRLQFKRRQPDRVYQAIVYGHVDPGAGTWRDYLVWDDRALIQKATSARDPRAAEAVSEYRVVELLHGASLIEVRLRSGRRNQIRIQAALRGHPLVGEERYTARHDGPPRIRFHRQALHAARVSFEHPSTGRRVDVEAPMPADLLDLLHHLKSKSRPIRREVP